MKNTEIDNHSIDLIDLIKVVWKGKWKLILFAAIPFIFVYIQQYQQIKYYAASTEITKIKSFDLIEYAFFNNDINDDRENMSIDDLEKAAITDNKNRRVQALGLYEGVTSLDQLNFIITKSKLFDMYVEILSQKLTLIEAMRKNNFLDSSQYRDEKAYNEALAKIARSIKIIKPREGNNKTRVLTHTIEFSHHDVEKWKSVLLDTDKITNELVNQDLKQEFLLLFKLAKQGRDYALEDVSLKINNLKNDYEKKINIKISYLKEQAAIAEKLNIKKNTIEVQTFGKENTTLFSNVKTDSPFYLRGYEAINKEISLIKARDNSEDFIEGLLILQQEKREIQQDKTLDRIQKIFNSTPLNSNLGKKFYAARIDVLATKFSYAKERNKYIFSIIFGLILGTIYIFASNAINSEKFHKKN